MDELTPSKGRARPRNNAAGTCRACPRATPARPSVSRTPSGFLLACSGVAGDDQVAEITELFNEIDAQIHPHTVLVAFGPRAVDELFAPNNPVVVRADSGTTIYFQERALTGWTEDAAQIAELGRRLRSVRERLK